tara:strand:- start:1205 stop:1348 length:144 start_codon:yes stop_codon:yes gene_type:complete
MFVSVPLAARKQRYSVEERRLKRNKRGRRPRNAGRRRLSKGRDMRIA